ncbi:MAG: pilus assembly protein [Desulfosporosinus sp.]|nr:pilus assembly protein [Desulfosporosinus sp.]
MNKSEKGQGMTELAIALPILLIIFMGMVAFATTFFDLAQAYNSGQAATHAAAIHIADGSGNTCYNRAMNALGNPIWIYVEEASFTIEPCSSTDPNWVGPMNTEVKGTWTLTINPLVPFIYGKGPFPITVPVSFTDTFR